MWFSQIQLLKELLGSVRGGWGYLKLKLSAKLTIIFKKRVKNSQCPLTARVSKEEKSAQRTGMETTLQPMEKTGGVENYTVHPHTGR